MFSYADKEKGFTLIELLIVIAILGIVASMAAPAYSDFIRNKEVMKMTRGFQSALESAKYHARTSGRTITVCGSNDINANNPQCLANLSSFNTSGSSQTMGWIVFRDIPDTTGTTDKKASGANETVFKRIPFNQGKVKLIWNGDAVIDIAPRNRTGDTGTMCIYSPKTSDSSLTECKAANALNADLKEARITLSALGKVTLQKK